MNGHVADDLGAYVLGNLSADEERAVRLHLEACQACRHELARIEGAADLLDSANLAQEPPDELEDRILRSVGRDPAQAGRRRRLVLAAAATVILAGAFFLAGYAIGRLSPATTSPDQNVALAGPGGARGTARVFVLPTGTRRIELSASGLPGLPPGVAWTVYLDDKRAQRRAAGSFFAAADGTARATLSAGASSADFTALVVVPSDQPPESSPALAGDLRP